MSSTTITVSTKTKDMLLAQRIHDREVIEQVINRLLRNQLTDDYLDDQILQDVQEEVDDCKADHTHTTKELKVEL